MGRPFKENPLTIDDLRELDTWLVGLEQEQGRMERRGELRPARVVDSRGRANARGERVLRNGKVQAIRTDID